MADVTTLPRSRPLTRADLDALPDDGHRYELLDGSLVVTPAPTWRHQSAVVRLWKVLDAARPGPEIRVFVAPMDVVLAADTVLQPDVLVARRSDLSEADLPTAPLLAVEVLSPSTRRIDLTLKRSRYEAAGCRAYWVVDPEAPSLLAWELRHGTYELVADVRGTETHRATSPYPVEVRPADLAADE
jgi:Uma2 family endonuclease